MVTFYVYDWMVCVVGDQVTAVDAGSLPGIGYGTRGLYNSVRLFRRGFPGLYRVSDGGGFNRVVGSCGEEQDKNEKGEQGEENDQHESVLFAIIIIGILLSTGLIVIRINIEGGIVPGFEPGSISKETRYRVSFTVWILRWVMWS